MDRRAGPAATDGAARRPPPSSSLFPQQPQGLLGRSDTFRDPAVNQPLGPDQLDPAAKLGAFTGGEKVALDNLGELRIRSLLVELLLL